MRQTTYAVRLTEDDRAQLRTLIGQGTASARLVTHARILLKADQGEGGSAWADAAIAGAVAVRSAGSAGASSRLAWRRRCIGRRRPGSMPAGSTVLPRRT